MLCKVLSHSLRPLSEQCNSSFLNHHRPTIIFDVPVTLWSINCSVYLGNSMALLIDEVEGS
jgi:hypothetical protein